MSVTPRFNGVQPPLVNAVAADFDTGFVSSPDNYSTVLNQSMAMAVPLGSQLALLTATNAGNPYVQGNRIDNQRLGSLANVLTGYNTLTGSNAAPYYTFSNAYGKF